MAESLWQLTASPEPVLTPLEESTTVDAIVIGAGFTGLSCALHLAQRGHGVIVLESREPGWGGSGRNAGQWLPGWPGRSPQSVVAQFGEERGTALNRFNADASRLVADLVTKHNIAADLNRSGIIVVAHTSAKFLELEGIHSSWAELSGRTRLVQPRDLGRFLTTERYFGGLLYEDGGSLNPLSYVRGLAAAAQTAGATIHVRSPAVAMGRHGDQWRIDTPKGSVVAPRLFVCTNAYSRGLWPPLDKVFLRIPMAMLASDPLPDGGTGFMPAKVPFGDTNRLALFGGMTDSQGRFVASVPPRFSNNASIRALSRDFDSKFRRVFAGVEPPRWRYSWMGYLCVVGDRIPRFYRLGPGAIAAMGYSGAGIAMGSALGREAARCLENDELLDTPIPVVEPKPLRFARIAPLVTRYVLTPIARQFDKRY
jgi:sarcosine oxidase